MRQSRLMSMAEAVTNVVVGLAVAVATQVVVDAHHVVYRGGDGHLHELFWVGLAPVQYGGNLTGAIGGAEGTGQLGSLRGLGRLQHRSLSRQRRARILSIYWREGESGLDGSLRHRRHAEGVPATPVAY